MVGRMYQTSTRGVLFGRWAVAFAAASLVLSACGQSATQDAAVAPQAPQAAAPPALAISIANYSAEPSKVYYYNNLVAIKVAPGYTCNIASGPVSWSTITVPAAVGATAGTAQVPQANSGIAVCISVGIPSASAPDPNTAPYNGPYLMESLAGGIVGLWQTWIETPLSGNYSHFLNGAVPTGSTTTWTAPNDASGMSFTSAGGNSTVTNITVNLAGTTTVKSVTPTDGPITGATQVSITGSGFSPGATATIGGNALTGVSVLSGSKMTGTLPAGTLGSQTVKVMNPGGSFGVLPNGYAYVNPPGIPPAPTATAGYAGQAMVAVAPGDGGPADYYTVTQVAPKPASVGKRPGSSPKVWTCTVTPPSTTCTVSGLPSGAAYSFVTTATNGAGTSPSSPPSAQVTVS